MSRCLVIYIYIYIYIHQILFYISFTNGYLFFRCLGEFFEEERNENKKENSRGVTANYIQ